MHTTAGAASGGAAAAGRGDDDAAATGALAARKLGIPATASSMLPRSTLQRMPDAPARRGMDAMKRDLQDIATRVEGRGDGKLLPQADQLYEQARPRESRVLPPGAAIIQVVSMLTRVRGGSGPAFRIVDVVADTPAFAARGTTAMDEARRIAGILEKDPACGLRYYVIPTSTPTTLGVSASRMGSADAAQKATVNFRAALQDQEARAVALRDMVRRGGRAVSDNVKRLDKSHNKQQQSLRSSVMREYARRLALVEAQSATPSAPPEGVRDTTGVEGTLTFPASLRRDGVDTAFVGVGMDTAVRAETSAMSKLAGGMEPWIVVLPAACGPRDNIEAVAKSMHEGYPLANMHQVAMYEWVHLFTADADEAPVQGHADAAADMGLQALQYAKQAHSDAQVVKEVLMDTTGVSLDGFSVQLGGGRAWNDADPHIAVQCVAAAVQAALQGEGDPQ
jgi:hypothetical protein